MVKPIQTQICFLWTNILTWKDFLPWFQSSARPMVVPNVIYILVEYLIL